MKCKDIQDRPILELLAKLNGTWATWFGEGGSMPDVTDVMPEGTPRKLRLAKMKMLIRRGLVDGCDCGCRGDFVITKKGKKLLAEGLDVVGG